MYLVRAMCTLMEVLRQHKLPERDLGADGVYRMFSDKLSAYQVKFWCDKYVTLPEIRHGMLKECFRVRVQSASFLELGFVQGYLYHSYAKIRKFSWFMTRKLSDTLSRKFFHSFGMVSRKNARIACANCFCVG